MDTRIDAAAAAICERRNAADWPCSGLDFDAEMARVALAAADALTYQCAICGGRVDLTDAAKPTMQIGHDMTQTTVPAPTGKGGGLLGYATDAECIAACLKHIGHLELVMRECCDAIRDNDEFGALRMLEVALKEPPGGIYGRSDVQGRPNAKLMAAAPDLLALLIESQDNIGGDWRARRDAAIAKATGVQNV